MLTPKSVDFQFNALNNLERIVGAIEQLFKEPISSPIMFQVTTEHSEDANAGTVGISPHKEVVRKRVTQVRIELVGPEQYSVSMTTDMFDESGEYERTVVHAGHIKIGPNPSIGFVERMP